MKPSDLLTAGAPTLASQLFRGVATLTLSDWKDIASIAGALLGAAYLLWKWRRESRRRSLD